MNGMIPIVHQFVPNFYSLSAITVDEISCETASWRRVGRPSPTNLK